MEQFPGNTAQNRATGIVYETPQIVYMMIAMTLFADYPVDTRMRWVKDYYDAISKFIISLPTPIMAGPYPHKDSFFPCLVETDDLDLTNATQSSARSMYFKKLVLVLEQAVSLPVSQPRGDATHTGVIF